MTDIRNVVLVGSDGSGKTTLIEAALYNGKAIDRFRPVEGGPAIMGTDPEEAKRGVTLFSAVFGTKWQKNELTLIDTPGETEFISDIYNTVLVSEGALVVMSPVPPVRFETMKIWEILEELKVPRAIVVNGMDREKADFDTVWSELKNWGEAKPVLIQYPIGKESSFQGVVDLITMKALTYAGDGKGKVSDGEIPADIADTCAEVREGVIETIVECDDAILEKYLDQGEVSEAELRQALRNGVRDGKIAPVVFSSAVKNMGVTVIMDLLFEIFPDPAEGRPWKGINPVSKEEIAAPPGNAFSGFVFKTQMEHFTGRLSYLKIVTGKLPSESQVNNPARGSKEKIGSVSRPIGKELHSIGTGEAGMIVVLGKLKETQTGDSLCGDSSPITYAGHPLPQRILSYALKPKSRQDEERISAAIAKLVEEDPTLEFRREAQTKELIISGMGQTHIDVAVERLQRKYEVAVDLISLQVPYRETIRKKANAQGKYKRQSGGRGQYGDTWIEIEPLPRGQGFEFVDGITGGIIPKNYIPAVEKGIIEAMEAGQLAGYPVVDVRAKLYDGGFHTVDSSDMAFKIAASMGFKKAFMDANPVILEPVFSLRVFVSDDYVGDVMGDLNSRRGKVSGVDVSGSNQVINALVPMGEVLRYAADLRSITQGRGTFTYEFSHYEEVPAPVANKLIEAAKKEKEEEK